MYSFILDNLPVEWVKNIKYNGIYKTFELENSNSEYKMIEKIFTSSQNIIKIVRVQNPFQYGRFKIRQEMCQKTNSDYVVMKL